MQLNAISRENVSVFCKTTAIPSYFSKETGLEQQRVWSLDRAGPVGFSAVPETSHYYDWFRFIFRTMRVSNYVVRWLRRGEKTRLTF